MPSTCHGFTTEVQQQSGVSCEGFEVQVSDLGLDPGLGISLESCWCLQDVFAVEV